MKNFLILISMFCFGLNLSAQDGLDARIQATYEVELKLKTFQNNVLEKTLGKGYSVFEKDSIACDLSKGFIHDLSELENDFVGTEEDLIQFRSEINQYILISRDGFNIIISRLLERRKAFLDFKMDYESYKAKKEVERLLKRKK